jgi:hypothetical protein
MVTQMRHILEGGYSIIETAGGFQAYRGALELRVGPFCKTKAEAEMQVHLEREVRQPWLGDIKRRTNG